MISSLSYTAERAKVIDFSLGYAVLRTVIAAPKSVNVKKLADLDGKTVGTVRGTTHDTQLTKEGPKGMKLMRYEDDATEAQAFLSGQVDIFSTAEMIVPQIDKKNPARQIELKFVLDNFKLCVGVKKGEQRLLVRGQQVGPGQHQERPAERSQQEVLRRRSARTHRQASRLNHEDICSRASQSP